MKRERYNDLMNQGNNVQKLQDTMAQCTANNAPGALAVIHYVISHSKEPNLVTDAEIDFLRQIYEEKHDGFKNLSKGHQLMMIRTVRMAIPQDTSAYCEPTCPQEGALNA